MATYTSKLNLKKPVGTEHVSRSDMNDNYDKIDANVVTNTDGEISNSLLVGTLANGATKGLYSFAQGSEVKASGTGAFASGRRSESNGGYSHAEGESVANGNYSHAENQSTANGSYSHSEGHSTANGYNSHSEGYSTANNSLQHTIGDYNVIDTTGDATTKGTYVEIVGNGSYSARSNARALDWSGNEYLKGDIYVQCDADSTNGKKITTSPFTGATSSTNGATGLVPAPSAGDQTKFLCADGTWGSVAGASDMTGATASTPGVHGLVPAPAAGDQTKFLSGAGTWEPVGGASDMTGATASTNGVHGLVPAPMAGDQDKVLKGDGTWGDAASGNLMPSTAISIPASGTSVTYNMAGITADYQLIRWNFSASAENNPPASLTWTTGSGTFTIANTYGTTSETIQPVFAEITGTPITVNT